MLKEILKKLGVEPTEDLSDEDAKRLINEKIDEKDTQISKLESEKNTLSKSNEELTASVDGYKSSEEKLNKELSETKEKLTNTEGRLSQVTEMYKEQFEKDPETVVEDKGNKTIKPFDILDALYGSK